MKKLIFLLAILALTACEEIVIDPECVANPTEVNDTIKDLSSSVSQCRSCHGHGN